MNEDNINISNNLNNNGNLINLPAHMVTRSSSSYVLQNGKVSGQNNTYNYNYNNNNNNNSNYSYNYKLPQTNTNTNWTYQSMIKNNNTNNHN